jgi:poly(3-hydroxybutyrate) depolymerase
MKIFISRQKFPLTLLGAVLLFGVTCKAASTGRASMESYGGRSLIVFVPSQLPSPGARPLVVVLHGGMGNAERIESGGPENGLNMNTEAEKNGFIVAYLNGTQAARFMEADKLDWNAGGGCC